MAGDIVVLRGTLDTVLLAAPAAAGRLRGLYAGDPRLRRRMRPSLAQVRRILQDDTNRLRLLRAWSDLRLPGDPPAGSGELIATRLGQAIESERIIALSLPRPARVSDTAIDRGAIAARVSAFDSPQRAAVRESQDISTWTKTQKVREMMSRVPGHLAHDLAGSFRSLLTLENAEIMAASLVVLAGLHAIGIGEAVDAGLAFYAWWAAGTAGLTALADMLVAVSRAIKARTGQDIDGAAVMFAGAFAVLGVSILTLIMTRAGRRPAAGQQVGETAAADTGAATPVQRRIAGSTAREDAKQAAAREAFENRGSPAVESSTDDAAGELHRPYIRQSVRREVEDAAPRTADGRPIDPNTGAPIDGTPDLGHKPGHEFWREKEAAEAEGLTQEDFNDRMNDPDKYQLEDPSSNRSHRYEQP
jgi:hypothetical protein